MGLGVRSLQRSFHNSIQQRVNSCNNLHRFENHLLITALGLGVDRGYEIASRYARDDMMQSVEAFEGYEASSWCRLYTNMELMLSS